MAGPASEAARRDGVVGSSLQAAVELALSETEAGEFAGTDWEELAIVSKATVAVDPSARPSSASQAAGQPAGTGPAVHGGPLVTAAPGRKCLRCWRVLEEVGQVPAHPALCLRCADVVGRIAA